MRILEQTGGRTAPTPFNNLVSRVEEAVIGMAPNAQVADSILRISTESLDQHRKHELHDSLKSLHVSIESIVADLGMEKYYTDAQKEAGTIAGLLAGNWKAALGHQLNFEANISTESMTVVNMPSLGDSVNKRTYGLEAYDERENRNATVYSIVYNMNAAQQDEFGETFFPTITMAPDNVGFAIDVKLMQVYDAIERKVSGAAVDFGKKNIIRAVADSTILKKDQTKITPIWRDDANSDMSSKAMFVDPAIIAPYPKPIEGESFMTAPLAVGKKLDLIGLSQSETLLKAGNMDMTDSLDPFVVLENVYVTCGTDVLKFAVNNLPLANFVYSVQNNYRVMTLNFSSNSISITKKTKNVNNSALTTLADIANDDLAVRLEIIMTGTTHIEFGHTEVFGNAIRVSSITNSSGDLMDLTDPLIATLVTALNGSKIIGYDLLAYRTNMNRRQRGQLIDVTKFSQSYNVLLRAPISTIHPINSDGETDNSDVQALITATRIRTSNESVTRLIEAGNVLREYVHSNDVNGVGPDVLGVGRWYVKPVYFEETIDMAMTVNSLNSVDRPGDIQAALVNIIRNYVYQAYRDSEYKAAADALAGGISKTPEVLIGTDPVISRYLTVTGDLRTIGNDFVPRVVSTLDHRMRGKIYIAFGVFDETRNTAPNPLNFGNMIWCPELVLNANISRAGTISKETVVQPRFTFIVNSPIMIVLTVDNIPEVVNGLPVFTHSV